VLGPILFIIYTADLAALVSSCGLSPHLYADDTQIFGSCSPTSVDVFLSNVNDCVGVVADWMYSNRLSLNQDKTEFIWCTTGRSCDFVVSRTVSEIRRLIGRKSSYLRIGE